jgi:5-carboxymethyl-2-hydroxymuconate isomerase
MPHFIAEYSANLEDKTDLTGLCNAIAEAALASGLFEIGAIRVRAVRCEHYRIADNLSDNAFLDCRLRMGEGRSIVDRKAMGDMVFKAIEGFLSPLFESPHFALTFSIDDIDSRLSWKRNAIHPRTRKLETKDR